MSTKQRKTLILIEKKQVSVAAPPACPTYLRLRAYFIILRMREILCMNAHETFVCTNAKYRTESPGQNSKITFFNWMTLTYDLDHQTPPRCHQGQYIPLPNFVTVRQSVQP